MPRLKSPMCCQYRVLEVKTKSPIFITVYAALLNYTNKKQGFNWPFVRYTVRKIYISSDQKKIMNW